MFRQSILFVLFFSSLSWSQELDIREVTKVLCSEEFHGRGYVNNGDGIAADFIAKQFSELGVKPLPGKSDYFQPFSFPVNTFPSKMQLSINGVDRIPGEDFLVQPSSGSFSGKLEYTLFNMRRLLDGVTLSDKIAENENRRVKHGFVFDLTGMTGDTLKSTREMIRGLANKMPIIELNSDKFTWSVATSTTKYPHVLLKHKAFELEGTIVLMVENVFVPNHEAKNVMGYIPAKCKSKKTVYLTAHYDHLGRMGAETYFPGGNDNASGTAMLITLGSYFAKNPQKFNIVFIAFAGEEAGLIGSRYYVENPILPLKEIRFLVNLDIMGSGEEGVTVVNATLFPKAYKKMVKINHKNDYVTQVKSRGPAANSDHYFFSENGVPSFFIYTMGPNKNYHDVYDTYDNLSFAEYKDITELLKDFLQKI